MITFNFFTKEDLLNLNGLERTFIESFSNLPINMTIFDINNFIHELMIRFQPYVTTAKNTISFNYVENTASEKELKQLFLLSSILIVKLREFFTEEKFLISLGFEIETNEYGETVIPFDDFLLNSSFKDLRLLEVSLNEKAILLNKQLAQLAKPGSALSIYQNSIDNKIYQGLWKKIVELGTNFKRDDINRRYAIEIKSAKAKYRRHFYKKNQLDTNVFVSPTGNPERPNYSLFYPKNPSKYKQTSELHLTKKGSWSSSAELVYFNRGHLYEWYKDILSDYNAQKASILYAYVFARNSLEPLFNQRILDNVPFMQGGDFNIKTSMGQYFAAQAKYQNLHLMSINQVYVTLKELHKIFQKFYVGYNTINRRIMAKELINLFVNRSTKNIATVNNFIEEKIKMITQIIKS